MIKKPKNPNYCATVVTIKKIIPLENCDNVVHANISGNLVIVSKDTKEGDEGIYFPVETQLSKEYLTANNLYRDKTLNKDETKSGYFESNGRIKCVKFRQNKSQGLFMPLSSITNVVNNPSKGWNEEGTEFDELNGTSICKKYVVKRSNKSGNGAKGKKTRKPKVSKIVNNQFRFHYDTGQLWKNIHKIKFNSLLSITYKIHGTSVIISNILCKKKLNPFLKILKFLKVPVQDKDYDYIYSSRRVVKNDDLDNKNSYYSEDIWGIVAKKVKPLVPKGITLYGEIAGYTPNGQAIQKDFDYGCNEGEHKFFVYRITYTNSDGQVFEFSAKQVQEWSKLNGLLPVPELYYGYAHDLFEDIKQSEHWNENFLEKLQEHFLEDDCYMCKNKVPSEGIVLRNDSIGEEAYKLKSFRFLEKETKALSKGQEDLEEDN